jgi:hypothetical protein
VIYDSARMERWVGSSNLWLGNDDSFIRADIQMLGHAEAPLIGFEAVVAQLNMTEGPSVDHALFSTQCCALSTYWMFGLYEMLRTLKRRLNSGFRPLDELFHDVSVVRMPLAKHQVKGAKRYPQTSHVAQYIFEPNTGKIGWRVFDPNKEETITIVRRDIADRFLSTTKL